MYTDRGGNLLSFLAYKVYQRLGVTKVSGSSHRHNTSGMCERTIQSVLTMLTCDMPGEHHHVTWRDRVPPILWSLNTSPSAATGFSPFFLEHGREPRDITSRAFDTSDVPAACRLSQVGPDHEPATRDGAQGALGGRHPRKRCATTTNGATPASAPQAFLTAPWVSLLLPSTAVHTGIGGRYEICPELDRALSSLQH